ncbi:hypothetical protein J2T56_001711, partial [Natronobacillus azotifigens]
FTQFCPNQPLFRTTLPYFYSILSESTTISDNFAFLLFNPVRINHYFGQPSLTFTQFCPNQPLFRTTLPYFYSILSESTTISDNLVLLLLNSVQINHYFGQLCLTFIQFCPNQPLFRTTLPYFYSILSESTTISDNLAFLLFISVRTSLACTQIRLILLFLYLNDSHHCFSNLIKALNPWYISKKLILFWIRKTIRSFFCDGLMVTSWRLFVEKQPSSPNVGTQFFDPYRKNTTIDTLYWRQKSSLYNNKKTVQLAEN